MLKKEEITCEIIKELCVLKEQPSGWRLECNVVSWNGAEPKIDIRPWAPDHSKSGKGVALTADELEKIIEAYKKED